MPVKNYYWRCPLSEVNVQFTCPDCDEIFSVKPGDILEKEIISCPKCGCELSEDELRHLKIAIEYLEQNKPN